MYIVLNGKKFEISTSTTLTNFKENQYQILKSSMEVNKVVIPKEKYKNFKFKEKDRVEIVTFIGGG